MFDFISSAVRGLNFPAHVGGPIAGVIVGALFSGLLKSPRGPSANESPRMVADSISITINRTIKRKINGSPSSARPNDWGGLFLFATTLIATALLLFAANLPEISTYIVLGCTIASGFCATVSILALFLGCFNSPQWWWQSILPLIASMVCIWLIFLATGAIDSSTVEQAKALAASASTGWLGYLTAALHFIGGIRSNLVKWLLLDMLSFIFTVWAQVLALLRIIHYVSLSSMRSSTSRVWIWIAVRTMGFGGISAGIVMFLLLGASYVLAHGDVYRTLGKR